MPLLVLSNAGAVGPGRFQRELHASLKGVHVYFTRRFGDRAWPCSSSYKVSDESHSSAEGTLFGSAKHKCHRQRFGEEGPCTAAAHLPGARIGVGAWANSPMPPPENTGATRQSYLSLSATWWGEKEARGHRK